MYDMFLIAAVVLQSGLLLVVLLRQKSLRQRLSRIEDNVVRQVMEEDDPNQVDAILKTQAKLCASGMSPNMALDKARELHGFRRTLFS